jgi:hypothetical protein
MKTNSNDSRYYQYFPSMGQPLHREYGLPQLRYVLVQLQRLTATNHYTNQIRKETKQSTINWLRKKTNGSAIN